MLHMGSPMLLLKPSSANSPTTLTIPPRWCFPGQGSYPFADDTLPEQTGQLPNSETFICLPTSISFEVREVMMRRRGDDEDAAQLTVVSWRGGITGHLPSTL